MCTGERGHVRGPRALTIAEQRQRWCTITLRPRGRTGNVPVVIVDDGHAQHHAAPHALNSTPPYAIITGALAIWGLLGLVRPSEVVTPLAFVFYAGADYF